jgi:hypothetical protein
MNDDEYLGTWNIPVMTLFAAIPLSMEELGKIMTNPFSTAGLFVIL